MGRQALAPTPSRSVASAARRSCPAPSAARSRGLVAVVARLRSHEKLRRVVGPTGISADAGGAAVEAGGGPSPRHFDAPAACPGAALQPASFRIEDLEEHQGGAIIFKVDYEGAPIRQTRAISPQPRGCWSQRAAARPPGTHSAASRRRRREEGKSKIEEAWRREAQAREKSPRRGLQG